MFQIFDARNPNQIGIWQNNKLQNKLFKTIEIQKIDKQKEQWKLLKYLFYQFLIEDDLFHYFFEPELIIRFSNPKVLNKVKNSLLFLIYFA